MDEQSKKMLDDILAQEPAALTDADKAFLRARSSYLNEEQRSVYAEVLRTEAVSFKPSDEASPSGKGRKSIKPSDEA
jgi:hypothetical protein